MHFVISWFLGGTLGAVVGLPVLYLIPSKLTLTISMGVGMFITFMWLRLRRIDY